MLFLLDARRGRALTNASHADIRGGVAVGLRPSRGFIRQDSLSLQSGVNPTASHESLPALAFPGIGLVPTPIGSPLNALTAPYVQRLLALTHIPSANPWPAYAQVSHDSNTSIAADARSRQRWLILFSLGQYAPHHENSYRNFTSGRFMANGIRPGPG